MTACCSENVTSDANGKRCNLPADGRPSKYTSRFSPWSVSFQLDSFLSRRSVDGLQTSTDRSNDKAIAKGSCMCGDIACESSDTTPIALSRAFISIPPTTPYLLPCAPAVTAPTAKNGPPQPTPPTSSHPAVSLKASPKTATLNKHWFCPRCGSNLYTELRIMPDVTCVKSGGLDGGAVVNGIGVESYTKERLSMRRG